MLCFCGEVSIIENNGAILIKLLLRKDTNQGIMCGPRATRTWKCTPS